MKLNDFKSLLQNATPNALTRYGDGEINIFHEVNCHRKGFKFDKETDKEFRKELIEAYNYKDDNYFVADKEQISACLFVNKNYKAFLNDIVPLFNLYSIILIGNEKSNLSKLNFKIDNFFAVSNNAWRFYPELDKEILIELKNYKKPALVLFACGPYSNVLIYRLWKQNKKHIFWNIGSTLDPIIFGENTRQYHERIFNNGSPDV